MTKSLTTRTGQSLWTLSEGQALRYQRICVAQHVATIAELMGTVLGISQAKADRLADIITGQTNLLDEAQVWQRLRDCSVHDFKLAGLTDTQAAKLIAAIELGRRAYREHPNLQPYTVDDPQTIANVLEADLAWEPNERFAVVALNIRHHVQAIEILSHGTKSETLADPKDIFGWLLRVGAVRCVVAHNHPSGNLDPSPDDLALTRQLLQSSKILAMPMLDHLILSKGHWCSIRQTTTLWSDVYGGNL